MESNPPTTDFRNAKVGDTVDFYDVRDGGSYTGDSAEIARLTARQVIIRRNGVETKYRRFDAGMEIGDYLKPRIHLRKY